MFRLSSLLEGVAFKPPPSKPDLLFTSPLYLLLRTMSFASSCAITLPHPLSETILKLGDVRANEPVARLSPVLTGYEQRTLDVVWITDDDLEVGMDQRRELCDLEVALEGEEEGGEGREGQRKVDRIEFYIKNTIKSSRHLCCLEDVAFIDLERTNEQTRRRVS